MVAAVLLVLSGHSSSGKGLFRWFFPACSLTTLGMPSRPQTNCSFVTVVCLQFLYCKAILLFIFVDQASLCPTSTHHCISAGRHLHRRLSCGPASRLVPEFSALVQLNLLISLFDAMRSKGIPTRCSRFRRLNCQEIC